MEMRKSQLETLNEGDKIMTVKHAKLNLMNFVIITFSVAFNFGHLIAKKEVKKGQFSLNFEMYFDPFCSSDAKTRVDLFIFHVLQTK